MLKWTVYGKKNIDQDDKNEEQEKNSTTPLQRNTRHSLDGASIKANRKPNRYQRRSFGGSATKQRNQLTIIDKENFNFLGSTPNYFREGFLPKIDTKSAFKDVSNVSPVVTPNFKPIEAKKKKSLDRRISTASTPPTYSRRIREAKKRKLEMTKLSETEVTKVESIQKDADVPIADTNDIGKDEIENPNKFNIRSQELMISDIMKRRPLITSTVPSLEIEYSPDTLISGFEIHRETKETTDFKHFYNQSTLPIFGSRSFIENPLYFSSNKFTSPIKNVLKSNEFETVFKSPSMDDKDLHTIIRNSLSPVSMTPLSRKLSDLRFSKMSIKRNLCNEIQKEVSFNFPRPANPLEISLIKDDEVSTEMENKFILTTDSSSIRTESTISDSQMGDVTLEKMIEDIIKSTKKVKTKRRLLKLQDKNTLNLVSEFQEDIKYDQMDDNEIFIKPSPKCRDVVIKEAKHVNLSRENSISPRSSPVKEKKCKEQDILTQLGVSETSLNRSFILNDGCNEREIKTPPNQPNNIIESNLRRQKCVRRKKSTASNESIKSHTSVFRNSKIIEKNMPSPISSVNERTDNIDVIGSSFNSKTVPTLSELPECDNLSYQFEMSPNKTTSSPKSWYNEIPNSAVKTASETKEMFGLTLASGIPSPITPLYNLKRPRSIGNDEVSFKSSKLKLDEEFLTKNYNMTPTIENRSKRCLTYSSEEGSFNTTLDKRSSVASNKFEKSGEKFNTVKGVIELRIICLDHIDVHVIRCRDLQRNGSRSEDINAYAKVSITGTNEALSEQPIGVQRAIFQRTSVLYGKREPEFKRHLMLPLPTQLSDDQEIHVSVWHRDKKYRRSEFLGCVSFPLKDAIKQDISGCFHLQSQTSSSRIQSIEASPQIKVNAKSEHKGTNKNENVAADVFLGVTDSSNRINTIEEMATETETGAETAQNGEDGAKGNSGDKGSAESRIIALQREADEHLFLRYLELDPEGDPGTPKKPNQQGKCGRTPFTITKKINRSPAGGFGFTVIWTRPPRVERITPGGAAERSGLKPGDYVVFMSGRNIVTAQERDVRDLVKSAGQSLSLEIFRRSAQNGVLAAIRQRGSIASHASHSEATGSVSRFVSLGQPATGSGLLTTEPMSGQSLRPGTACSGATTTISIDAGASRRRLHLPQVTFSKEEGSSITPEQQRKRALLAVVAREQHYATCLQFGMVRFVGPLIEKPDLITPSDHQLLFQNIEEILRLSEDVLDQTVPDDGDIQTSTVVSVYLQKTPTFLNLYRRYCSGLKRADCVLVKKSRDSSGAFNRFCTTPPIPRRRPDITSLVHKPLEQFRELLRLMRAANLAHAKSQSTSSQDAMEKKQLQSIVDQLQAGYQEVTAGSGMMGLAGDGKPLLSVADLESRLVFTRCKPFVLGTPGRQWIFGGELSKVGGRTVKPYWALLFSDMLLFATVSRDRVLFVTEEPVLLTTVAETCFNVKKKVTEFHLILGRNGGVSPLVSCSPRTLSRRITLVLRAPSIDLKAVWQSLLQRQIYRAHTMCGTPLESPMDSPMEPAAAFSLMTLESQRRQPTKEAAEPCSSTAEATPKSRTSGRNTALHIAHWMKRMPVNEEIEPPDSIMTETWSVEELRKRSQELNLIELNSVAENLHAKTLSPNEKTVSNDVSPSKSSNSGSQITVRTSPVVLDKIPVCRQCHKKCISKPNSPSVSQKDSNLKQPTFTVKPSSLNTSKDLFDVEDTSDYSRTKSKNMKKSPGFDDLKSKARGIDLSDPPQAALKVIDSVEQNQKRLKSKSYALEESPLLCRSTQKLNHTLSLEKRLEYAGSLRSASPSSSSRNSPLSTSHTTCSSQVFNSSGPDIRNSPSIMSKLNSVQCVIAQEKIISELKSVESIVLHKKIDSPDTIRRQKVTKKKAENVLSKVLGVNIVTKVDNIGKRLNSSSVFLEDESTNEDENDLLARFNNLRNKTYIDTQTINGDINSKFYNNNNEYSSNKQCQDIASDDDLLMLMGFSAIKPAAHLVKIDPFRTRCDISQRPATLQAKTIEFEPPNISIVPPTPDAKNFSRTEELLDESPDSPLPDDPPYVALKRYGTMSSLERMPSDETDDGNVRIAPIGDRAAKMFLSEENDTNDYQNSGGLMSWTARAGSFVAEKMSLFNSYNDASLISRQPSFLERYLGVGDWKNELKEEERAGGSLEGGEGSGASGEEAWGTPSSGDLSDNAFPDSDHGTLSSPTKSSSSYAGDDDTELMMDELLMAPTITGPIIRPLLPRRRLEPLLEEEGSDTDLENDEKIQNISKQGSVLGPHADVCYAAPNHQQNYSPPPGVVVENGLVGAVKTNSSPDHTPTNEVPSIKSLKDSVTQQSVHGASERRSSDTSTESTTTSTLGRTTIQNVPQQKVQTSGESNVSSVVRDEDTKESQSITNQSTEVRLSPRAEMRLALDQGKDMMADQEDNWGGAGGPWSWRGRSVLRRVASAEAVLRPQINHTTTQNPSSVYAWKENEKMSEMERLARADLQMMPSHQLSTCQNGKILNFLKRRSSSASPVRSIIMTSSHQRPFSPRRQNDKQFEKRFWKQVTRRRKNNNTDV